MPRTMCTDEREFPIEEKPSFISYWIGKRTRRHAQSRDTQLRRTVHSSTGIDDGKRVPAT
jgi:hypothetical protein